MRARLGTMARAVWGRVRRLPASLLLLAIRAYQLIISPMSIGQCKYYPTCSSYAYTAIRRFGAVRGTGLALWRLARCNPWSLGGVDHVPAKNAPHSTAHPHRHRAIDPLQEAM